jgi:lysine decarboxylase
MNTILLLTAQTLPLFKSAPLKQLNSAFAHAGFDILNPETPEDLLKLVRQNPQIAAILFDWDTFGLDLCKDISNLNEHLPLFGLANQNTVLDISPSQLRLNLNFFEYRLDTAQDILGKIRQGIDHYIDTILPPFTKALFEHVGKDKYTYCTPGHLGGAAFRKSPAGSLFHDFFGPNIFKADISIGMEELGTLLDHTGSHREAEEYLAQAFNADRSYIVTNGTSTANKMVGMFATPAGSTILVDRNCHKSLTHLMMMRDVMPIYLRPTRNAYGLLGGIAQREFTPRAIEEKIAATPGAAWPTYAVITNSTYDGLLYNTEWIKKTLDVRHMHFDSAWVPYTHFHPIYKGKYGMSGETAPGKVVYETQSTHKLLAAFSQASMVHVKGDFDQEMFNEVYMMHTSTSPLYAIVASAEIAGAMMNGNSGRRLMQDAIDHAMDFRHEIKRLKRESNDWFFDVWQPEALQEADCWPLRPEDDWHGFQHVDPDHLYLDPIKITLLTPGMCADGTLGPDGIPAAIVSKYLDDHGIVVEKTGPYNILFLFSIGMDKPKSLGLLHALSEFKRGYDQNRKVREMLPGLYHAHPDFYREMRIQTLTRGIHQLMRASDLPGMMFRAFETLPQLSMTPHRAFECLLAEQTEEIEIENLKGKNNANMILPYPPGVPLIMPGEKITDESIAILNFLLMLIEIGKHYPGFETNIHGVYPQDNGRHTVKIVRER